MRKVYLQSLLQFPLLLEAGSTNKGIAMDAVGNAGLGVKTVKS